MLLRSVRGIFPCDRFLLLFNLFQNLFFSNSSVCYLGSHSHVFKAVDMGSGYVLWQAVLGDRIESSAVLSKSTDFVIVGKFLLLSFAVVAGHDSPTQELRNYLI